MLQDTEQGKVAQSQACDAADALQVGGLMEEFSVRIAEIERKLHDAQRDRDNYRAKYDELSQRQQPSSEALIAEKDGQGCLCGPKGSQC